MKENKLQIKAAYDAVQKQLEYLIMATPTGPVRDRLTEANLFIMWARQDWAREDAKVSVAVERRT